MFTVKRAGFTLIELLIAVSVSTILVVATVQLYTLIRNAITQDQNRADMAQNARVSLERLSRDLRQTPDVVTVMPADASDNSVTEPNEIEFQDGHANDLTYRRYYLDGTQLELDTIEYYFASAPSTRVKWNATSGGNPPVESVISTQDIADMVQTLNVYGNDSVMQVEVITTDGANQTFSLETTVEGRN